MILPKSLFLTSLFLFPLPLAAQDLSASIAAQGLAATQTRLAALPSPTEADRFALGGVRFLRALETTFQTRHRTGMDDPTGMLPLLRLNAGAAPDAVFQPGDVAALFDQAATDMPPPARPSKALHPARTSAWKSALPTSGST